MLNALDILASCKNFPFVNNIETEYGLKMWHSRAIFTIFNGK